jgi:pimeloyl-ACP methyl ester carboxylesterase
MLRSEPSATTPTIRPPRVENDMAHPSGDLEPAATDASADRRPTPWRPVTWQARDGITLYGRVWGDAGLPGLPLLCLPGLTRNADDFDAIAAALSSGPAARRVVCFDFRGRGRSGHAPVETYTPATEADDTALGLAALGLERVAILGTSRGGLVAMVLALTQPQRVAAAILNDIAPVIERAGLARIAGYVGVAPPADWDEAAAALKASQGEMFPGLDAAGWRRFARQIHRDEAGRPVLSYDPKIGEAFKAFDPANPPPPFWPGFEALAAVPAMVIHGALSDILSAATVAEMAARHPHLTVHTVADEGHAPLLWDEPTQRAIAHFLAATDVPPPPAADLFSL